MLNLFRPLLYNLAFLLSKRVLVSPPYSLLLGCLYMVGFCLPSVSYRLQFSSCVQFLNLVVQLEITLMSFRIIL